MGTKFIIQIITSAIGSVGIAMLFRVRIKHLGIVALLSGACYGIYYLFEIPLAANTFLCAFVATALVAIASELLARILRTPTLVFLLSCIIPIVPGSFLYRAMNGLIKRDMDAFTFNGIETLKIALGTAGGIVAVSVIVKIILGISDRIKAMKKAKKD